MNEVDEFELFEKRNGFIKDQEDSCRSIAIGEYDWKYILQYEGYAYVLYMEYQGKEVPLTHFRDAEKLQTFYDILNTNFSKHTNLYF